MFHFSIPRSLDRRFINHLIVQSRVRSFARMVARWLHRSLIRSLDYARALVNSLSGLLARSLARSITSSTNRTLCAKRSAQSTLRKSSCAQYYAKSSARSKLWNRARAYQLGQIILRKAFKAKCWCTFVIIITSYTSPTFITRKRFGVIEGVSARVWTWNLYSV